MTKKMISIATEFSRTPAGRYVTDGPKSGQAFRENCLVPSLKNNSKVIVDLNNTTGFGSSFLEEAFGGLVRSGFTAEELHKKLELISDLKTYKNRVWKYIEDADRIKKPVALN